MKKKVYLSLLFILWTIFMASLFIQKRVNADLARYKSDLRTEILRFMEKEETLPELLAELKTKMDLKAYRLEYELLSDGAGCRVTLDGRESFELWLGEKK
ncbi:MAG: hypothetical protein NE330_16155 [Lentisphaeraceae bacterium]|nr:hypothetical protein [Lentisphaeraceae bacterium]